MMNTMSNRNGSATLSIREEYLYYIESAMFYLFVIVFAPVTVPYMLFRNNHTKAACVCLAAEMVFAVLVNIFVIKQ